MNSYNFRRDSRGYLDRNVQDTSISGSSLAKMRQSPCGSAGSTGREQSYGHRSTSPSPLHTPPFKPQVRVSSNYQRYAPTTDAERSSFMKYFLTIFAFIISAGLVVVARKSGLVPAKPEGKDIEFLKSQVEGVKMASAHLHSAKQDMEDIYSQMNYMLGDFKDLAENLELKNVQKPPHSKDSTCGGCPETDTTALDNRMTPSPEQCDMDTEELADYALESAGGTIVSTGKTQNYREPNEVTFLGVTLCSSERGPQTILQPAVLPGNCWAFKGQSGSVVIQLSTPIQVTGVTIDHISKEVSPYELHSAPKEFSLHGTNEAVNHKAKSKVYYGRFVFEIAGTPSQYFPIEKVTYPVDFVELRVHSNHGNIEYTCLYRIRIHGIPDATIHCDDCDTENDFG